MAQLPFSRYRGTAQLRVTDAVGNHFWAFQDNSNKGRLILQEKGGAIKEITPGPVLGRPAFDVTPTALYFIGNQEVGANELPPCYVVKEYIPWKGGLPPVVTLPATSPVWQLWTGVYTEVNLGTFAKVAASFNVLKNSLIAMRDLLVALGMLRKG